MQLSNKSTSRVLAALLLAAVLIGTLMPGADKQRLLSPFPAQWHIDKVGHICGFMATAFFGARARISGIGTRQIMLAAVLTAAATELLQNFIPGRTPLLTDVMIDVAGAFGGVALSREQNVA